MLRIMSIGPTIFYRIVIQCCNYLWITMCCQENAEHVLVDTSAWICFFSRRGFEDLKKTLSTLLDEDRAA
jgi:hypothetical protein